MSIAFDVVYFLQESEHLTDYMDETCELADKVNVILYDLEDDKLGRIRDVYSDAIERMADWVENNYETDPTAAWLLQLARSV